MYKRILVAVDGSATADGALREAIELARALGARLRLVYVVDTLNLNLGADFPYPPEMSTALARTGRDVIDKAGAVARAAGVEAETRLAELDLVGQRVPEMLVTEAESWSADLIVLGTHGRRGLSHLFLGSVAEGVARIATRPVLLVRSGT